MASVAMDSNDNSKCHLELMSTHMSYVAMQWEYKTAYTVNGMVLQLKKDG